MEKNPFKVTMEFNFLFQSCEAINQFDFAGPSLPIISMWSEYILLGGLWGGKLLVYNVEKNYSETISKHSEAVAALQGSEK